MLSDQMNPFVEESLCFFGKLQGSCPLLVTDRPMRNPVVAVSRMRQTVGPGYPGNVGGLQSC